jgi:hypothetical protein
MWTETKNRWLTIAGWSKETTISPVTIHARLARGWPIAEALGRPAGKTKPMKDSASIMIRVDPELKASLTRIAKAEGRTISNLCKKLLADFVSAQPKGKAKP